MSKKANPAAIGVFVVGAVILAVVSLVIFGSGTLFRKTETFLLYFQDSINGLEVGAPVKFKGVRIGQVTDIRIRFNQDDESPHVPVFIQIDIDRLQNSLGVDVDLSNDKIFEEQVDILGLRGKLQQASFVTGMLFIELDYDPNAGPAYFVQLKNEDDDYDYKEIPTVSSGLTEVIKKVTGMVDKISKIDFQSIGEKANDILTRLDDGMAEIQFKEINDKAVALLDNLDSISGDPEFKKLPGNLNATLDDGRKFIATLDKSMDGVISDLKITLNGARSTLGQIDVVADNLNNMLEPESPLRYQLESSLSELSDALRSIRVLADYLERNPSALLIGKQNNSSSDK
ncbi:MCE family protein [Ruficoccus amylovorans]|uniref:MCE family protein n=1 Tax=Ruficoccus amylovorans TaxID=1804625 RepID=A0A842HGD6_9BACT|nr:MlaD family protein [Ruficoccus amylovorans]MBC2595088.1 MCE family protein [Ruficoccus amylovorans]